MRYPIFAGLFAGCAFIMNGALAQEAGTGPNLLSLEEAERLSSERDTTTRSFEARGDAFRAEAVAESRLPDPKLRFGVESLPMDSWSLDREAMTQLRVGVVQEFPRGQTRVLKAEQALAWAEGENARAAEQRLRTFLATRQAWWEVWYQSQALETVRNSKTLFQRLLGITEAQYAAGRDNQQAVLGARVEAARLADREDVVSAQLAVARAELARWIGSEPATRPLPAPAPDMPSFAGVDMLISRLNAHPALGVESAVIAASNTESEIARQSYRPAFALDLSYSKRFGSEPDGSQRSDLVTAMVEIDMPLFPGNRQDKRVAASVSRAEAARYERESRLRELRARLEAAHANWQRLTSRLERYRRETIPQEALNTAAADRAYGSRTVDFATLVRAHLSELESRIEALRVETDRAQTEADLAYFSGEEK